MTYEWKRIDTDPPRMLQPVLVAWDGSTPSRWNGSNDFSAYREEDSEAGRGWIWIDCVAQDPCDWDDEDYPTHWTPWPEFNLE